MTRLTKNQRDKLLQLCKQISTVQDDVWDAYETTLMSDAKSSVYELWLALNSDKDIPDNIKRDLFVIFDAARSFIIGEGTTYERSQKSHSELAVARRFIEGVLAQDKE